MYKANLMKKKNTFKIILKQDILTITKKMQIPFVKKFDSLTILGDLYFTKLLLIVNYLNYSLKFKIS